MSGEVGLAMSVVNPCHSRGKNSGRKPFRIMHTNTKEAPCTAQSTHVLTGMGSRETYQQL